MFLLVNALFEVCLLGLLMIGFEIVQVTLNLFMDPIPVPVWYVLVASTLLVSVGIDIKQIYSAHRQDASRSRTIQLVRFGTNCLVYFLVLTPMATRYGLNSKTYTTEQIKASNAESGAGQKFMDRIFLDTMNIALGRVVVTGNEIMYGIVFEYLMMPFFSLNFWGSQEA